MRLRAWFQVVLAGVLGAATAAADPVPSLPHPSPKVDDGTNLGMLGEAALRPALDRRTVNGGLRVVLDPRPGTGSITFCSVFDVGYASESEAELGFVRLGAAWLGDIDGARRIIAERGGTSSTSVELDRTSHCTTVPANELALGVWAETRRFAPGALTAERLDQARGTAEAGLLWPPASIAQRRGEERLLTLGLRGALRTERSPLASLRAVTATSRAAMERFVRDAFRPERCVLAVSGDFDPSALMTTLSGALPLPPNVEPAPRSQGLGTPVRQINEVFAALREENVATPLAVFGWVTPTHRSPDQTALELAASVLGGGAGSILHEQLVVRAGQARSVRAFTTPHRGVGLMVIEIELTSRAPLLAVETAVTMAVRRLATVGPTPSELARARAMRLTDLLTRLDGGQPRALELATRELCTGDVQSLEREPGRYAAVSTADVRRVVGARLTETSRILVEVHPPGWPTGGAARPERLYHLVEPGDTLGEIAARFGVSIEALTKENAIPRNRPIFPGQKLRLPSGAKDSRRKDGSGAKGKGKGTNQPVPLRTYSVLKGDTLGAIAKRHRVTATALARANGLDPKRTLRIGQKLVIPSPVPVERKTEGSPREATATKAGATAPEKARPSRSPAAPSPVGGKPSGSTTKPAGGRAPSAPRGPADPEKPETSTGPQRNRPAPTTGGGATSKSAEGSKSPAGAATVTPRVHVVRSGETLSGIAKRYRVTTTALARKNGLDPKKPIRPGQRLAIPE
ncbi:MAG: LysM peptidoglycan-binding domain-containing protein [Polyangiaceae bacterium]|nr:LysM peptidoglycan-binding domain-containing protein [Polyangiaceae bacterium]